MKGGDIERGNQLYPGMMESPELRWSFIRKVYSIICMQLLLTAALAAAVVFVNPISRFLATTTAGNILYLIVIVFTFITMILLVIFQNRHPWNFVLLLLFTLLISLTVGVTCAFTKGKIILEAAILTTVVVVGLTLYTFWAAKGGQDFSFLGPFLFASLLVLLVFSLIMVFFPMGKLLHMIYGCLAALLFSAFIVYDTDNLIKRFTYDDYIIASVSIYLDIINLFVALLAVFGGDN